jgi:type IV pilus assembly protein PilA
MNTAQKGFTLIELMIVIAIIGILAAIAIPQYQNYITKSQVSRVMGEAGNYKTAVEDCANSGKVTGATSSATTCNAGDLGLTASNILGETVSVTGTNAKSPVVELLGTGAATIVATFGNSASAALKNPAKTLTWTRSTEGNWTCATTAEAKHTPSGCTSTATTPK